jgi:hypothetical protein
MNNEIRLICRDGSAQEAVPRKKSRKILYKVLRYMLLWIGIVIIGIIAIPTVLLAIMLEGVWFLLDCILSRLDE